MIDNVSDLVCDTIINKLQKQSAQCIRLHNSSINLQVFPDITICNVNLFNELNTSDWNAHVDAVTKLRARWPCDRVNEVLGSALDEDDCDEIWNKMTEPTAKFGSLPLDVDLKALNQMIVACDMFDWDKASAGMDCTANVTAVWDPVYYMCYRIHIPNSLKRVTIQCSRLLVGL